MQKRIGIDASALRDPLTGVGNYLYYLLLPLLELHKEDHFFLYCIERSSHIEKLSEYDNVTIRHSSWGGRCNALWSQITLAWMSFQDRLDLFWGAHLSVPIWKRKGQKNILTLYDFTYLLFPSLYGWGRRTYLRHFDPLMIRKANLLISISYGTQKKLRTFYQRDSFVIEPPLKPSVRRFSEAEVTPYLQKYALEYKKYALILGTIEPRKGILPCLRAYATIEESVLPLVLVGQRGWYRSSEHEQITHLMRTSKNRILEWGYLPDEEVAYLLSGAAYLLMPSLYEGYGMGIKEARSVGSAVICSEGEEMVEAAQGEAHLLREGHMKEDLLSALKASPSTNIGSYRTNKQIAEQLSSVIREVVKKPPPHLV